MHRRVRWQGAVVAAGDVGSVTERPYAVEVAVAHTRPPVIDEWRAYRVMATSRTEAELIAGQMAACTSVMPVFTSWSAPVPVD